MNIQIQSTAKSLDQSHGTRLRHGLCIGAHRVDPLAPEPLDRVLTLADRALSAAKRAGRNSVVCSNAIT